MAHLVQPLQFKELLSPADVIAQFNATGLGAWYLTRTKLTPPTGGAAAMVQARNEIQRGFVEGTRLGIPVSMITEALHSGGPDCTKKSYFCMANRLAARGALCLGHRGRSGCAVALIPARGGNINYAAPRQGLADF